MGKIVVSEFVSLDGVMEAPGGKPGHTLKLTNTLTMTSGAVVLTYQPARGA